MDSRFVVNRGGLPSVDEAKLGQHGAVSVGWPDQRWAGRNSLATPTWAAESRGCQGLAIV